MSSIVEKAVKSLAERKGLSKEDADKLYKKVQVPISPSGKEVGGKEIILAYDSFGEGIEPVYFWILDFMRDKPGGLGFQVSKTAEDFEASVGSSFFSEYGTKASIMQDRAIKLIGMINTVVRSVMNILYDLKEFEIRLEFYRNMHSKDVQVRKDARLGLKQIWLDRVDMQRGRGAIHSMAQQLSFVTLRDAFLSIDSEKDIEKMDLNERVKRILGPRIQEYLKWEKMSEIELTRRYKIEKLYLKSQISSLKLYALWAKPYIIASQKLKTFEFNSPDIVSIFNNLQISTNLFAKKEQKPDEEKFKDVKLDKKIYACIEVEFDFRTFPHLVGQTREGNKYAQGGRVDMVFRAFALTEEQANEVEHQEVYEGLELVKDIVEGVSDETLKELQDEIDKYTKEEPDEGDPFKKMTFLESIINETKDPAMRKKIQDQIKELKKTVSKQAIPESPNPFSSLYSAFKELVPKKTAKKAEPFVVRETIEEAKKQASKLAYVVFRIFKKQHGMFAE